MNRRIQLVLLAAVVVLVGDAQWHNVRRSRVIDYAAVNAHAVFRGYSSVQREQIEIDRRLFKVASRGAAAMNRNMLFRWVEIGDPGQWIMYLFGEEGIDTIKPGFRGSESVRSTYYDAPGQGTIIFRFQGDRLVDIDLLFHSMV